MLITNLDGSPREYVGSWSDITEQKTAQEKRESSERRYHHLFESMIDAYIRVDINGKFIEVNSAFANMTGYTPEELYSLSDKEITPENWHTREDEIYNTQTLKVGYSDVYEKEYRCKDGSILPVELRTYLIRDLEGTLVGMSAIVRDIRERKRVDAIVQESEKRLRTLLEHSLAGIIVIQNIRIVYANPANEQSFGYKAEELYSLSMEQILGLIHPEDKKTIWEGIQTHISNREITNRFSVRIFHKNGGIHWLDASSIPIVWDGQPAIQVTTVDLTNYRLAELALRQSEETSRIIMNSVDASIIQIGTDYTILALNDTAMNRIGKQRSELLGTNLFEYLPEIAQTRKPYVDEVLQTGKPVFFEDERQERWYAHNLYPAFDDKHVLSQVVILSQNITTRKHAEDELRQSEERYRTLAEASPDFIFIIDQEDKLRYVNSYAAARLGIPTEEIVGQRRDRFFPESVGEVQKKYIHSVFKDGKRTYAEAEYQFQGSKVWLGTWLVPLKDSKGNVTSVLGVSRDITDSKRVEAALRQSRNELEDRVSERTAELRASQEQLRKLTSEMIKAQEDERRHISRELHDEAGQALVTLKYSLVAVSNELPGSNKAAKKQLADSTALIDQTVERIRLLAQSLRPPVLEVGGLNMSLDDFCQEFAARTRLHVNYRGQEIPYLPDAIGISLFRFVQEALTNILKHAQATQVEVTMEYRKNEIKLSVADNGRGMEEFSHSSGIGLLGIDERLKLLEGNLSIHSRRGGGTKLVARVPWIAPDND